MGGVSGVLACAYRGCGQQLAVGQAGHVRHAQPQPQSRPRHSPQWVEGGEQRIDFTELEERPWGRAGR
jgi:hypothetical protein